MLPCNVLLLTTRRKSSIRRYTVTNSASALSSCSSSRRARKASSENDGGESRLSADDDGDDGNESMWARLLHSIFTHSLPASVAACSSLLALLSLFSLSPFTFADLVARPLSSYQLLLLLFPFADHGTSDATTLLVVEGQTRDQGGCFSSSSSSSGSSSRSDSLVADTSSGRCFYSACYCLSLSLCPLSLS